MSYSIEHGKRVLILKTDDRRFDQYGGRGTAFYVHATADNNVTPRRYDWSAVAHDDHREWAGEVQMPALIWEMGAAADGGSIKPWGKDVSGIGYLQGWKKAAKAAQPIDGWRPTVSIWLAYGGQEGQDLADRLNRAGPEAFSSYDHLRQPVYDALKRLFPRPFEGGNTRKRVETEAELLDALFLFKRRHDLPFSLYLVDDEKSAFFAQKE